MNKGLKENTTQLTLNVGSLTSYINLSNIDSNLIFTIPLLSTLGLNSFELSLIFNYQNKNVISIFGKALKLNYYSKITVNDDLIELENADGFTYEFIKTSETVFTNLELNSKIEVLENNEYKLSDKYGNYKLFNKTNLEYPYLIKLVSGLELHLDFVSDIKTISNSKGDLVKFHLSNNLVDSITYEKNDDLIYSLRVEYTKKNEIKLIDLIKEGKTISSYIFEYATQYIIVKDFISKYKIKYTIENNRVVSLVDSYEDSFDEKRKTKIEYSEFVTKVTAYLENSNYYFFNSSGLLDFKLNPNFYATSYEYNNLYNLTHTSSMLNLKNTNNLLPKYDISNFIIDGDIEIEEISIIDTLFNELLKNHVSKISGTGKLSLNIPYNGIAGEPFILSFFAKSNNNTNLEVTLKLDNVTNKTFKLSNNFSLFTLGTLTQKSFKTIGLELNISSADIEIGRVELLQKDFGSYFEYDENKNLVSIFNKAGYSKLNYESNIVSSASLSDTKSYYKYDKLGNLIETDTIYSKVNKNTYDTNNLLTSSESLNSNIKFIKTYKYNLEGNLIESKEEGSTKNYSYDTFKRVINITDSLNNILNYNYDEFDNIRQIILSKDNNYIHSKYKYDTQNRLETITMSNGDYYDFYYDTSNNLINIKLNEVTLVKYSYYSNNKLESIEYPNFDKYKFIYDDKENLTKIYYIKNNKETLKYECIYNEFNDLESIKDSSSIIKTYKYDLDSRISEEKSNNLKLNYRYNNLDNVILKKKEIKDNIFFETLDNIDKSLGVNPDSILDDLLVSNNVYIASFSKDLSLNNKEINSSSKLKLTKDGIIPCIEISSEEDKLLSYRLTDKGFDMTSGSISLWFKPSDINTLQYLFSQRTETGFGQINLYIKEERLNLEIINQDNKKFLIIRTKKEINQDSWNFFSLDFVYRCDTGLRKDYIFEVNLNLNGKTYKYISQNQDLYFDSLNPTIYIGYYSNGKTNTNFFNGKIALLLLGKNRYVSPDKLTKFYRITKDYIIENEVKDDVCALNYSLNSIYKIDKDMLNTFDIFPLSNSVYSLNGTKPISFDIRNVSSLDKNRTFTFNKYIKEYAFQADSNKLEYDFNISSCGSIYMSIYTDILCDYQYIFESVDRNNHNISLYLKDSYLYININGTILETYINVDLNMWHDIGFSFMCLSNSLKYNIYVDNVSYEDNINLNFIYSNLTFSIGRTIDEISISSNLGSYETCFPLNGQIRNLCVSNTYSNEDIFNSLINNLNHTTHISLFDEFNRIKKSEIKEKNKTILSNIYSYRLIDNMYSSYLIDNETIKYGTTSNKREYYYDSLGNVVKINDSLFGLHNYAYDYRGYLIKEDNINYTYDQNGNILTAGSDTFTYDNLIKDRLIKFNDKDILYFNNTLYKYDKKEFKFETNKLISISEEYIDGGRDISFTYNLEGLIETKTDLTYFTDDQDDVEDKTYYYYEKNNLITLISEKYRFDFLYDEYNKLYGFILNNDIKYYYIRDNLCNILGIIDEKFNLIVRYVYDAFGNILHLIDTSQNNIGTINPFRFKGYFYDNDLKMYYLKSRFYIPLWRRFLTEDNINYLDIYCVNNINLYSYARNNPVNYIDPFGNFAISLSALIGALLAGAVIGGMLGACKSMYADYKDDNSINGSIGKKFYICQIVGGIFTGLGSSLATVMGAGVGLSVIEGTKLSIVNCAVSYGSAFASSLVATSVASGLDYFINGIFSEDYNLNFNQFFKELFYGGLSGLISFGVGYVGGYLNLRIPGNFKIKTAIPRTVVEQELSLAYKLIILLMRKLWKK